MFRKSVTCLTKLRVGCAAVVARMVWLLPGLGRRDKARLATTWACSCVTLTFSSVTVSSVSPSTASVRGDTTYERARGGGGVAGKQLPCSGPPTQGELPSADGEKGQRAQDSWFSHRSGRRNGAESGTPGGEAETQRRMREVSSGHRNWCPAAGSIVSSTKYACRLWSLISSQMAEFCSVTPLSERKTRAEFLDHP